MNDGTNNNSTDTDNGTNIGEYEEMVGDVQDISEDINSISDDTGGISDAMGDTAEPASGTEDGTEDIEENPISDTENNVEVPETTSESGTASYIDYTSDLNHIDSLLYGIRTELQGVKSVSGNSIMVSFDDDSMQAITEIQEKQDSIIDNQNALYGLLGCLVFAVCAEWLIGSAKRSIKNFTGRKE